MSDAFNSSLSALGAFFGKMDITANNIANVNLAEEVVNLITTEHAVSANVKTITTRDEMEKQLIDIIA